ncbi:MAG: chemotaxis protein CheW [Pseudomonadota bacterium]
MARTRHHGIFKIAGCLVGVPIEGLAEVCVVSDVSPIMDARPGLLGTINLRGKLVPLKDLAPLFGLPTQTSIPKRAAILQHKGQIMAAAVEDIIALSPASPIPIGSQSAGADTATRTISESFLHGTETVSCLDVEGLFASPDVPTTAAAMAQTQEDAGGSTSKLLIVSSGGASFAIDAIRVHATVPRLKINTSEASTAVCLGFVEYQDWKIPVVDAAAVLGLGRPEMHSSAPIVILRMAEDRLLGLAVTSMERITIAPSSRIFPSSAVIRPQGLLPSAFVLEDGLQTHVVDLDALARIPDLAELASLSMRKQVAKPYGEGVSEDAKVRLDQQKYLLYRAGAMHATATSEIVRILVAPDRVVDVGAQFHPSICGLFEVDRRSIPLVGIGSARPRLSDIKFVLLVGPPDAQIGYAVEGITGVLQSVRRAADVVNGSKVDLVELHDGRRKRLVTVTSLDQMARDLVEGAQFGASVAGPHPTEPVVSYAIA